MTSRTVTADYRSPDHRTTKSTRKAPAPYSIVRRFLSPSGLRHGFMPSHASDMDRAAVENEHATQSSQGASLSSPPEDVTTATVEAMLPSPQRTIPVPTSAPLVRPPPPPPPPPPEVMGAAILGRRSSKHGFGTSRARERLPLRHAATHKQLAARDISMPPDLLPGSEKSFYQLVQETIQTQEKLIGKRLTAVARKNDLRSELEHFSIAHEDFGEVWAEALPAVEMSALDSDVKARLTQAWNKSKQQFATLRQRQQALEDDRDMDLLRMESRYLNQITELASHLKGFVPPAETDDDAFLSQLSEEQFRARSRPPSMLSSSSQSTISVHRRYLRTIGTINLLRDRLFNWKADLHLELAQRDFDREDGLEPAISDRVFFISFEQRYRAIVNEYWETKKEMVQTYQECRDEGLDPAPANLPPYLDYLFSRDAEIVLESSVNDGNVKESDVSRNILQWARHVDSVGRLGAYESVAVDEAAAVTAQDHEDELRFIHDGRSTVAHSIASISSEARHTPSFDPEVPKDRWRYSAPMLLERTGNDVNVSALDYQSLRFRRTQGRIREFRVGLRRVHSVHSQD